MLRRLWTGESSPTYSKVVEDDNRSLGSVAQEEQRLLEKIRTQRRSIVGLLCLCTFLLLSLLGQLAYNTRARWMSNEVVPRMPKQTVIFEKQSLYAAPSTTESDLAWTQLVPPSQGFVSIENADNYDLPPGMSLDQQSGELYNIAAFHQIHCLASIRRYLWHFKFATDRNQTGLTELLPDSQEDHVLDCFDYLRQSVMCAGDTTLEYPAPSSIAEEKQTVSGWGVKHQCIDWNALLHFTEANKPPSPN